MAVKMKSSGKVILILLGIVGIFFLVKTQYLDKRPQTASVAPASDSTAQEATASTPIANVALTFAGSTTVGNKLAPALVKGFMESQGYTDVKINDISKEDKTITGTKDGKETVIAIAAKGTKKGFKALTEGKVDICMASAASESAEYEEHVIGLDGIAIVTEAGNPLKALTLKELRAIFDGTTKGWNLLRMDDNAGISSTFKEMVKLEYAPETKQFAKTADLVKAIGEGKQTISFISYTFLNDKVKAIPIKAGALAIEPNALSIQSEKYGLCRRLYMYSTPNPKNALVGDLLKYIESIDGQKIVEKTGFVKLSIDFDKPVMLAGDPKAYTNLLNTSKKFTTELRFATGSSNLDSRGLADINRLITYLSRPDTRGKSLILVGFSDNTGGTQANIVLSKQRAETVKTLLEQKGATIANVMGFGPIRPVRSNDTDVDRAFNRRVEIWVL